MKIAILDDWQNTIRTLPAWKKMAGHDVTVFTDHNKDVDELAKRLADVEVIVCIRERTPIPGALIERLPKLRMITQVGVFPHVDVAAATKKGVIISSLTGPGRPSYATAELNWGLIIAAMRRIPQEAAALKAGKWQAFPIGSGIRGKTLGIFGYGKIGAVVAGYGKAFGMKVQVWGRASTLDKAKADGYDAAKSREAFYEECDVISLHLRLIPETRGIVTAADLARMKPTALLVNTSRAGLVEAGALEKALKAGRPGMAAIDVFEDEPVVGAKHPLLSMDNVIAVPHLGYVERDSLASMFETIFDQVLAYAAGKPINVQNPDALKHG
jgi:D-3-phosphoglycerate dehydrogenase